MAGTQIVETNGGSGSAPKLGMYNALDSACGGRGRVLYLSQILSRFRVFWFVSIEEHH
jgi:hypothetical protein